MANRKERRIAGSQKQLMIQLQGKLFTVESAITLAANQYTQRNLHAAIDIYRRIIAKFPDNSYAHNNLGTIYQEMRMYDEALTSYHQAIAHKSDYAEAYNNRASLLQKIQRYDEALANYDQAIAHKAGYIDAYFNRGTLLISKGDMQQAESMFRKALELKPDFSGALQSLTKIRKYTDVDHADVKAIQQLLSRPATPAADKEHLYFALGKIFDDCGHYDEAFEYYRQGNSLIHKRLSYNGTGLAGVTNAMMGIFTKDFLAQRCQISSSTESPVFIIGMPRSGTTLMAGILSNHSSVKSAGELPTISELVSRMRELTEAGISYPQATQYLTPAHISMTSNHYVKRLRRDADDKTAYVIDKYPLNFWHLGFITMLFPHARIIHCTRNPLDTVLSNYFQLFSTAYDYAFDLTTIRHFYEKYSMIMEHWRQALPIPMLEISYEQMITDTEHTARRALDFLKLPWDARCLEPHTNPAAVETASQWQVRQPIYTDSIERWRHYEKYLAPANASIDNTDLLEPILA